ncbi:hypothetical protein GZH46_02669, partial [Fragariocoptes setiger]
RPLNNDDDDDDDELTYTGTQQYFKGNFPNALLELVGRRVVVVSVDDTGGCSTCTVESFTLIHHENANHNLLAAAGAATAAVGVIMQQMSVACQCLARLICTHGDIADGLAVAILINLRSVSCEPKRSEVSFGLLLSGHYSSSSNGNMDIAASSQAKLQTVASNADTLLNVPKSSVAADISTASPSTITPNTISDDRVASIASSIATSMLEADLIGATETVTPATRAFVQPSRHNLYNKSESFGSRRFFQKRATTTMFNDAASNGFCSNINANVIYSGMAAIWSSHQANLVGDSFLNVGAYVYDSCTDLETGQRQSVRIVSNLNAFQQTTCEAPRGSPISVTIAHGEQQSKAIQLLTSFRVPVITTRENFAIDDYDLLDEDQRRYLFTTGPSSRFLAAGALKFGNKILATMFEQNDKNSDKLVANSGDQNGLIVISTYMPRNFIIYIKDIVPNFANFEILQSAQPVDQIRARYDSNNAASGKSGASSSSTQQSAPVVLLFITPAEAIDLVTRLRTDLNNVSKYFTLVVITREDITRALKTIFNRGGTSLCSSKSFYTVSPRLDDISEFNRYFRDTTQIEGLTSDHPLVCEYAKYQRITKVQSDPDDQHAEPMIKAVWAAASALKMVHRRECQSSSTSADSDKSSSSNNNNNKSSAKNKKDQCILKLNKNLASLVQKNLRRLDTVINSTGLSALDGFRLKFDSENELVTNKYSIRHVRNDCDIVELGQYYDHQLHIDDSLLRRSYHQTMVQAWPIQGSGSHIMDHIIESNDDHSSATSMSDESTTPRDFSVNDTNVNDDDSDDNHHRSNVGARELRHDERPLGVRKKSQYWPAESQYVRNQVVRSRRPYNNSLSDADRSNDRSITSNMSNNRERESASFRPRAIVSTSTEGFAGLTNDEPAINNNLSAPNRTINTGLRNSIASVGDNDRDGNGNSQRETDENDGDDDRDQSDTRKIRRQQVAGTVTNRPSSMSDVTQRQMIEVPSSTQPTTTTNIVPRQRVQMTINGHVRPYDLHDGSSTVHSIGDEQVDPPLVSGSSDNIKNTTSANPVDELNTSTESSGALEAASHLHVSSTTERPVRTLTPSKSYGPPASDLNTHAAYDRYPNLKSNMARSLNTGPFVLDSSIRPLDYTSQDRHTFHKMPSGRSINTFNNGPGTHLANPSNLVGTSQPGNNMAFGLPASGHISDLHSAIGGVASTFQQSRPNQLEVDSHSDFTPDFSITDLDTNQSTAASLKLRQHMQWIYNSWISLSILIANIVGALITLYVSTFLLMKNCEGTLDKDNQGLRSIHLLAIIVVFFGSTLFVVHSSPFICLLRTTWYNLSLVLIFGSLLLRVMHTRAQSTIGLGGRSNKLNQFVTLIFIVAVQVALEAQRWRYEVPTEKSFYHVLSDPQVLSHMNATKQFSLVPETRISSNFCLYQPEQYLHSQVYVGFVIVLLTLMSLTTRRLSTSLGHHNNHHNHPNHHHHNGGNHHHRLVTGPTKPACTCYPLDSSNAFASIMIIVPTYTISTITHLYVPDETLRDSICSITMIIIAFAVLIGVFLPLMIRIQRFGNIITDGSTLAPSSEVDLVKNAHPYSGSSSTVLSMFPELNDGKQYNHNMQTSNKRRHNLSQTIANLGPSADALKDLGFISNCQTNVKMNSSGTISALEYADRTDDHTASSSHHSTGIETNDVMFGIDDEDGSNCQDHQKMIHHNKNCETDRHHGQNQMIQNGTTNQRKHVNRVHQHQGQHHHHPQHKVGNLCGVQPLPQIKAKQQKESNNKSNHHANKASHSHMNAYGGPHCIHQSGAMMPKDPHNPLFEEQGFRCAYP